MAAQFPSITRAFVETPRATIHYAACGEGAPLLLLHQTPRSWNEFRQVLPLLGRDYRAIAMDTVGFGDSAALPLAENSIEAWAECAFAMLDALRLQRVALVGHHTGSAIAIEMAASHPHRITAMVLSAPPYVDAERRRAKLGEPVIDDVEHRADGRHLVDLWRMRQPFYPPNDVTLLDDFLIDALKAGPLAAEGHRVVSRYTMETRLGLIRCPVRVLVPLADPHAAPYAGKVAEQIHGASLVDVPDAMVPFPDQLPAEFTEYIANFISTHSVFRNDNPA